MPIAAYLLGEVRLRAVTEDDLPSFYEHQRDPVAYRMAAFQPRERDAFMTHWRSILRDASALSAFLQEVEERPIYAGVAETNVSSIRVLHTCGFTAVETGDEDHAGGVLPRLG
jgi:hypothetical protein